MTMHQEKGPQRGEALGARRSPTKGPRTRTDEGNGAGPRWAVPTRLSVSPGPLSQLREARPPATRVPTLAELQALAARGGWRLTRTGATIGQRQFALTRCGRAIDCAEVDEVHAALARVGERGGQGKGVAPA